METTPGILETPVDRLPDLTGRSFGPSSWMRITQEMVTAYADVSQDRNPVHIDPDFAAGTPFGTTIAHGYLTLSYVVPLMAEVFTVTGASLGVNYGLNRLRFPAPVPVGGRIRLTGEVAEVAEAGGSYQLVVPVVVEVEGFEKPACVAELVLRYYR